MSDLIKSAEWHARRAKNIGSSEVAALFGCQAPYAMSLYALWYVKAGIVPPPNVDNQRTRAGTLMEDAIAAVVAHENGWEIERDTFCVDPMQPGMSCTPDRKIIGGPMPAGASGPGAMEVKNVDYKQWKLEWTGGEPPLYVLLQHQHQMACKGYNWGVIGGYIGGNTARAYPYLARPALIADIRRRVAEFWQSIADNKPPPVDGSDSASDVLASLYPEIIDDSIDMRGSNKWPIACADFVNAGEERRIADKVYDAAKNRVIDLMAGHKRAWGSGWSVNTAITPAKDATPAPPGYMIPGRKEVRRYTAKEMEIK